MFPIEKSKRQEKEHVKFDFYGLSGSEVFKVEERRIWRFHTGPLETMSWLYKSSSSRASQEHPRNSTGQNGEDRQHGSLPQHQALVNPPSSYHEDSGRYNQQQPYAQHDGHASQQHERDNRMNRHDQQYENLAQHQAPANVSPSYQDGPGRHHQQQVYSQGNYGPRTQTHEPREASHSSRQRKRQPMDRTPLFRQVEPVGPPNVVIFGETGTGKSSLINMLSDEGTAPVSNRAVGCTFESAPYTVSINARRYTLWDTAGLNEGDAGSIPGDQALRHLRDLIDNLKDGLSLLVYCIRGSRFRDIIKVNYDLFTEIVCQGEVPVVIVITGLENEENMEDWWKENEQDFTERNMKFRGHACITTSKGKKNMFEEEYEESLGTVRALIQNCCPQNAWVVDSDQWLDRITYRIQEYYDTYNGCSRHETAPYYREEGEPFLFTFAKGLITFLMGRRRT